MAKESFNKEISAKVEGVTGWGHQRPIRKYARPSLELHPRLNRAGGVSLYIKRGCLRHSWRVGYVPRRLAPMVISLIKKRESLNIEVKQVLQPNAEWDTYGLEIVIRHS